MLRYPFLQTSALKITLVLVCALLSFKPMLADEIVGKSSLTVKFKGNTYTIPYTVSNAKVKSIHGQSFSKVVAIDSKQTMVSFVGLSGLNKVLNLDFGGVRLGEETGEYNFQVLESASYPFYFGIYMPSRPSAQETYFATQHFFPQAQNGVFFDLSKGGKRWQIVAQSSRISVTKSDQEKLEGTFSLALKLGKQTATATGTFDIYK